METLEDWLRRKVDENEKMHDYAVATDTIRVWIDIYNELKEKENPTLNCKNSSPPCAPNLKFGMLVCDECDWAE